MLQMTRVGNLRLLLLEVMTTRGMSGFAGETGDEYVHVCPAKLPSSEAKTMKTKSWKVIANTGKQADLESGLEKKVVQKPTHISARDFIHWLSAESHIDDDSLRSLFKL